MMDPTFWDVLEVFDLDRDVGGLVSSLELGAQERVQRDLAEFFDLLVRMLTDPLGTMNTYRGRIAGLPLLRQLIAGEVTSLLVRWNNCSFRIKKNEFGTVIAFSLVQRSD